MNENNEACETDDKSGHLKIDLADKLKTRKRRIMEQKEKERERKQSIVRVKK